MQNIIKSMSLFANGGIGEFYFRPIIDENGNEVFPLGVKNVIANELLGERCRWYSKIFPHCQVIPGSIEDKEVFDKLVELGNKECVRFLMVSPPCQNVTIANNNKDKSKHPMNRLVVYPLEIIKKVPTIDRVMFENAENWFEYKPDAVPELKGRTIGKFLEDELSAMGFKFIHEARLNAADYGLPQSRKRSILIAAKEQDWEWSAKEKQITLKDAISHLPSLEPGQYSNLPFHNAPLCNKRLAEIMRHTPTGHSAWENINPLYHYINLS